MNLSKENIQTALIDADIMLYRAAWKHEGDDVENAYETIDAMFEHLFYITNASDYLAFLTGKGNFRKEIAVTKEYKGNRKDKIIPEHLNAIREYLIEKWQCDVVEGLEADDALGICQNEMDNTVICSIDKDLLQIKGYHYNWNTQESCYVNDYDAWMKLYEQTLAGDSTDNIVGIPRVGVKTAKKILAECFSVDEAKKVSLYAYKEYYKDDNHLTMFKENYDLVKICTSSDDSRLKDKFIIPNLKYIF